MRLNPQLVLSHWREMGTTIFMVTHDLKEGFTLGTRLWVFDKLSTLKPELESVGAGDTYDLPIGRTIHTVQEVSMNESGSQQKKNQAA